MGGLKEVGFRETEAFKFKCGCSRREVVFFAGDWKLLLLTGLIDLARRAKSGKG